MGALTHHWTKIELSKSENLTNKKGKKWSQIIFVNSWRKKHVDEINFETKENLVSGSLCRGIAVKNACFYYTYFGLKNMHQIASLETFSYFVFNFWWDTSFNLLPTSMVRTFPILVWKNVSILSPKLVLEYAEDILSDSRLKNCAKCKGGWCKSVCVERFEIWVKKGFFW